MILYFHNVNELLIADYNKFGQGLVYFQTDFYTQDNVTTTTK